MGYSPLIILLREVSPWLIDASYTFVMGNLDHHYFIESFLMPYGVQLSKCLGFSG